jgi:sugar phosphate isomerase/epimerase
MADPTDLSVQLYTVRSALTADADATLARLAELGFRKVEPYQLLEHAGRLLPALRKHGLTAPTAHADILTTDPDPVFAAAWELGVATVIQPWLDPARWTTEADVLAIADQLNLVAERAATFAIRVGYHNHHFELESRFDGRQALEVLADHLAPEVALEVDTYRAFAGGADVPALLRRLGARVEALHIKDGDGSLDTSRQVAAGAGVVPIREIVEAAPEALRVVELDDTVGDLFDAVRESRRFVLGLAGA